MYRPRRARWPLVAGLTIVSFVVGLAAGAVLVGSRPPDLGAAASPIRTGLAASAGRVDGVEIEYREVAGGAGETALTGSLDALARSRQRYAEVAGALGALDPARVTRIEQHYTDAQALIERRAGAPEVEAVVAELRQALLGE